MTIKQKQCLLTYLGYYTGSIDGLWGTKSMMATEAFQNAYGIGADGIFGPGTGKKILEVIASGEQPITHTDGAPVDAQDTGTFWDGIKYFKREEFQCQCPRCGGFPVEPQESMVHAVDEIRLRLGKPVTISSGIRCKAHNTEVGGVSNSQHLFGTAADLHCPGATQAEMKEAAEAVLGNTGGIGLYSWGIHVDTRNGCSRWNG